MIMCQNIDRQILLKYCLIINFMLIQRKIADGRNGGVIRIPSCCDMIFKVYG